MTASQMGRSNNLQTLYTAQAGITLSIEKWAVLMTGRILLVNFGEASEGRLTEILRQKGYRVSTYACEEPLAEHLSKLSDDIDLIVLDASGNDRVVHDQLGEIRLYRAQHGHRPTVLCVSRIYRGPQIELELERKGARVVYVR
jgi:hypothetical protein